MTIFHIITINIIIIGDFERQPPAEILYDVAYRLQLIR